MNQKKNTKTNIKGQFFESQALKYLYSQNYQLIQRNYKSAWGEIDLIVSKDNIIAFVEVKYRKNQKFVEIGYTITPQKQKRIFLTAQYFLQNNSQYKSFDCRFDAIFFSKNLEYIQDIIQISE